MALKDGHPITFQPVGITDSVDSTNSTPGSMALLQNLVPSLNTRSQFVPRPAAVPQTDFSTSGYSTPTGIELQLVSGSRVYGFVATADFGGGFSEPYIFDQATGTFVTITGMTAANLPFTQATSGDWTPPTGTRVGGWVVFTHPGFTGSNGVIGWLDMTGFSIGTLTATTVSGNPVLNTVSSNPLLAGVRPGQTITGAGIPANTRVVSVDGTSATITMSNPASANAAGVALTIAGGTFAAPLWASGNTNNGGGTAHQGRALPAVPTAVAEFNGRAYYAVANALNFSDAGDPLQISDNPNTQVITYENGLGITALAGIPYTNLQGGIVNSLIAFQGAGAIQQVTGDPTTNNLATNLLLHGTGTLAPNTIDTTPQGLAFVAPDGVRFISLQGVVSDAIGTNGDGIAQPFVNAQYPSRMCAAYNSDVYRVAVQTTTTAAMLWGVSEWGTSLWGSGTPVTQEYWFHTKLGSWSGPHTFPSTLISSSNTGPGFIVSALSLGATLFSSMPFPTALSVYSENGVQLICTAQTSLLPDQGDMSENSMVETTIGLGSAAGATATVEIMSGVTTLDTVSVNVVGGVAGVWGSMIWGSGSWGAGASVYGQYRIAWNHPLIFKQCSLVCAFPAAAGMIYGNTYMRYQRLGYMILGLNNAA